MSSKSLSLSEAIREGARLHPEGDPNHYFTWKVNDDSSLVCIGSDALGAVYEAVTGNVHHDEDYVYQRLHEFYGHALTQQVVLPNGSDQMMTQEEAISQLGKTGWTREEISKWIASDPIRDLEN